MHWTLEVDETFLKVVQKNSIRLARWNPAVQVVRVLKCQPNHVHVLESAVQTLGHFHSVFSGEISLGRKGRLYYKTEFSTLWVNVKYYMKPTTMSFKLKKLILTWNQHQQVSNLKFHNTNSERKYINPATASFKFKTLHRNWKCEKLHDTSDCQFQIHKITYPL